MREALSRLRRESERLGDGAPTTEKVAVPPQAEEAVTTSSTGRVHQPSHGSPEEKELSVRPLPRFVVRAAPALEHTPPVEKAAPSRPLTGSAGQDGEWLRHARQLLYAAIDAQAPSHRAVRPAEGAVPRQSETDAAAHAGQPPRDDRAPLAASALERPSSLETVVSLTVGAGEGDARLAAVERRIARRYVPPSSKARGVMVEAVRSAAQAVAAQLSALGPGAAADAAVPIRAGEARRPFSVSAPAPSADVLLQPPARPQVSSPTEGLTRGETLAPEVQLQLSSQIVQAIRLQWGSDGGDVHLRLQPQYLGELTISLKVDHGAVTAHLEASTPEVRWWIESNDGLLRHSLAAHDLRLDRLVVTEQERSASTPDSDARQDTEHRPPPRRRQASDPDADTTFEIVV